MGRLETEMEGKVSMLLQLSFLALKIMNRKTNPALWNTAVILNCWPLGP